MPKPENSTGRLLTPDALTLMQGRLLGAERVNVVPIRLLSSQRKMRNRPGATSAHAWRFYVYLLIRGSGRIPYCTSRGARHLDAPEFAGSYICQT